MKTKIGNLFKNMYNVMLSDNTILFLYTEEDDSIIEACLYY